MDVPHKAAIGDCGLLPATCWPMTTMGVNMCTPDPDAKGNDMTQTVPTNQISDDPNAVEIEVRVRYPECDPAGVAHHSVYAIWLELARTELLRRRGEPYADLVARGVMFVVARMAVRYRRPAKYDDLLRVRTWIANSARAKVDHEYEIYCGDDLVATAQTTLVCVDAAGQPVSIPDGVMSVEPGK